MRNTCDMEKDCPYTPTHIGSKGYIYCADHALTRRQSGYERTRRMRPWELRWIAEGKVLPTYAVLPEPIETPVGRP